MPMLLKRHINHSIDKLEQHIRYSSGSSANLANGDVISFSGTSHSGASVSGSYSISDVSQETVQDFLNAVEQAFSNNVTASIDSSGALKITDKTTGNSQLAVSL
jgi:flagellar hook-associated protein 2